jgi:uncharacterized membrane protein
MNKGRLEAFSDGVLAVIITIMVLDIRAPHGATLAALRPLSAMFLGYVLSFVYVGIYWNNHHHLLQATEHVSGGILWANLHLLFWLSLAPFATAWMGSNPLAPLPVAAYGCVLLSAAIAYFILTKMLVKLHGPESKLRESVGRDTKGLMSLAGYLIGIGTSFYKPWIACMFYVLIAILWLKPDDRIEHSLRARTGTMT